MDTVTWLHKSASNAFFFQRVQLWQKLVVIDKSVLVTGEAQKIPVLRSVEKTN